MWKEFSLKATIQRVSNIHLRIVKLAKQDLRPMLLYLNLFRESDFFGDADTDNIFLRVFDANYGKVVWHNKSLSHLPCDSKQIMRVKNEMIDR